jgi:hypothetical protein
MSDENIPTKHFKATEILSYQSCAKISSIVMRSSGLLTKMRARRSLKITPPSTSLGSAVLTLTYFGQIVVKVTYVAEATDPNKDAFPRQVHCPDAEYTYLHPADIVTSDGKSYSTAMIFAIVLRKFRGSAASSKG